MKRGASPGSLQAGIMLLTVTTALIHLQLAFPNPLFILNGLGYLALLGALYRPPSSLQPFRPLIRWALIGYAAVTIVAWSLLATYGTLGYLTKGIELILIVLLWIEDRQEPYVIRP